MSFGNFTIYRKGQGLFKILYGDVSKLRFQHPRAGLHSVPTG